jgi:hypothetical protein
MLEMNNEMRELAFKRAPIDEMRARRSRRHATLLVEDGKLKILNGRHHARGDGPHHPGRGHGPDPTRNEGVGRAPG